MSKLHVPTPLRAFVEGQKIVEVDAPTVGEALRQLAGSYPQLKQHLFDDADRLRPYVNLFLNGQDVRSLQGPETTLAADDTLMIVPSIAGGGG